MNKLRVNFGKEDWHVDLTVYEFEDLLKEGTAFVTLPLLLGNEPHSKIRVRPQNIAYYYEEITSPDQKA